MLYRVYCIQYGIDCPEYYGIQDSKTSALLQLLIEHNDPDWILMPIHNSN